MVNVLLILLMLSFLVLAHVYLTQPRIEFSFDRENKTVKYKMSVDLYEVEGIKAYSDRNTTNYHGGPYVILVSAEGNGFVLAITKDSTIVKGLKFDLKSETTTKIV